MNKVIWKFDLEETIQMPKGAEILTLQTQNGKPCIWALVDKEEEPDMRSFETFGTGHPIHYDMGVERKYIGTYQELGGNLIWHLFERIN